MPPNWSRTTAAAYLDARQQWWMDWPKAQRDHATACVSCHTAIPYAIARPALRDSAEDTTLTADERRMLGYVTKRVTLWKETEPFYSNEKVGPRKTPESRGTESVLNALVLARYDQPTGYLRQITRDAFANMWAMQLTTGDDRGSWDWLNFHNAPWESDESHYWGTTLAMIAVGMAPENYRSHREIQPQLQQARAYLRREYDKQPLVNRIYMLWAAARVPGLLTPTEHKTLLAEIAAQQQKDGGWTIASLGRWKRRDDTPLDYASDGYATGLVVYALRQAGISTASPEMRRGRQWLVANQAVDGHWDAASLNKRRDPTTDAAKFMSDAATAYASMALMATGSR